MCRKITYWMPPLTKFNVVIKCMINYEKCVWLNKENNNGANLPGKAKGRIWLSEHEGDELP